MGDLGLPGSVVEMADDAAAEGAVGGAQGRPQHHDEPEGRRQAGELHRGLRGAARAPGRVHRRLTEVFAQARHARHLVRARLGRHAARAADPRHARATAPPRCARSPRKPRRWCASTRAPIRGEHGDGLCRGEWIELAVRAAPHRGLPRRSRTLLDPDGPAQPRQDRRSAADGRRARCSASRPALRRRRSRCKPALDWSAWNVQNDPRTEAITAPGSGGDATGGFAKAVEMCNNNGHCRKFDAGTMCPSFRVTRDEQHLTRGRANTLRLALSGQLGPDALTSDAVARGAGPVRQLQGLQARLPDRRRHGAHEDRVPRALHDASTATRCKDRLIARPARLRAVRASRVAVAAQPARPRSRRGALGERLLGLSAQRALPTLARRHVLRSRRDRLRQREATIAARAGARPSCSSSTPSTASSRPRTRSPRARVLQAAGYTRARRAAKGGGARCAAAAPSSPPAWSTRRASEAGALLDALLPFADARHRRSSASSRRAC